MRIDSPTTDRTLHELSRRFSIPMERAMDGGPYAGLTASLFSSSTVFQPPSCVETAIGNPGLDGRAGGGGGGDNLAPDSRLKKRMAQ